MLSGKIRGRLSIISAYGTFISSVIILLCGRNTAIINNQIPVRLYATASLFGFIIVWVTMKMLKRPKRVHRYKRYNKYKKRIRR